MEPDEQENPEATTSDQGQTLQSTLEQTVDDVQSVEMSGPHLQGVVIVLIVAGLLSLLMRRIARSNAAGPFRRWLPVAYSVVWGVAIVIVTMMYARGLPNTWFLAIWLLFLVVVFASVGWLRSVMSGVALSIEGRIRLGDSIRVGGVEGEVIGFGMRAIRLRSVEGTIHEIPNEKLVTEPVANLTGDGGDSACELTIAVPDQVDPDDARDLARNIAVLTPLASPRHRPEVFLFARGQEEQRYELKIRGFAFDAAYQDHFRSDVVARLQSAFAQLTESRDVSHEPPDKILVVEE